MQKVLGTASITKSSGGRKRHWESKSWVFIVLQQAHYSREGRPEIPSWNHTYKFCKEFSINRTPFSSRSTMYIVELYIVMRLLVT